MKKIKKILTVAGSDTCGGAGIQADIKTISAMGHFAMSAITAVTAQNTMGVRLCEAVSAEMMRSQLQCVYEDIIPDAVKTGMIANCRNAEIIAELLRANNAKNVVCDTVIMSSSGHPLISADGLKVMTEKLFPVCDVLTPNIPEAEKLCGMKIVTRTDMENAARILSGLTRGAVLVKGGHYDGDAVDILYHNGRTDEYISKRIDNPNTHGTGCTLSSAIACGLAEGKSCYEAVSCAKEYITKVISAGFDIGHGHGPMWHFV